MIYKVMADLNQVDLNELCSLVSAKNLEVCIGDDNLYFYDKHDRKVQISNIMKKVTNAGFIIKPIMEKPKIGVNDFVSNWCFEKMTAEETERFEAEHQKELKQMMTNIQTVQEEINQNKFKEGSVNGEGTQEEGSSAQSAT